MNIQVFNKDNQLKNLSIKAVNSTKSNFNGSINSFNKEYEDIEEAINTKLSMYGDISKGTIEFGNGFGISGSGFDDVAFTQSSILYKTPGRFDDHGFFQVKNVIKYDVSQVEDPYDEEEIFNLTCDSQPTDGSSNLLTSGAVWTALQGLISRIEVLEGQNS